MPTMLETMPCGHQPSRKSGDRSGFTLIEMIIVVMIIAALAALSYTVFMQVIRRGEEQRTRMTVDAVVVGIEGYALQAPSPVVELTTGAIRRWWDLDFEIQQTPDQNRTQVITMSTSSDALIIDGNPAMAEAGTDLAQFAPSWYRGFAYMTGMPADMVNDKGEVIDAWGQPLRIAYDDQLFGSTGYGVWSTGRDTLSDPFGEYSDRANDDIRSWTRGGVEDE